MIDEKARMTIPEEVLRSRLAQSEQMREFFIEMWKQNPALAKQGGARVQSLLTPLTGEAGHGQQNTAVNDMVNQRGISLIELIMFIVIVSVALAGILVVMNTTTKGSADPLIHKQAIAAAESLLEEIELQDFNPAGANATVTQANRASQYHIVSDYNGFATTGIFSVTDAAAASAVLANYNANVTVANAALGGITVGSASAVLVTVTVTDPQNNPIEISGYRTAY